MNTTRAFACILSASAVFLLSGIVREARAQELPKIPGYAFTFAPPRNDISIGAVVARWKKPGKMDVICSPGEADVDYPAQPIKPSDSVTVIDDDKEKFGGGIKLQIVNAISFNLGGNTITGVHLAGTFKPMQLTSTPGTGIAASASSTCQTRAKFFKESHPKELQFFSIITDALLADFVVTVDLDHDFDATVDPSGLLASSAIKAKVGFSSGSKKQLTIAGQGVFYAYNADDGDFHLRR